MSGDEDRTGRGKAGKVRPGSGLMIVTLPAMLVLRLRAFLSGGSGSRVTQTMVDREVARRLRASFEIEDLLERFR
jgi:hypothetical protein